MARRAATDYICFEMAQPLIARVKNGRLVLDEPTDLPEGEEVRLLPVDEDDELDDEERAALYESLDISAAESEAGELIDADIFMAELNAKRA